jgi:hypothetical protein
MEEEKKRQKNRLKEPSINSPHNTAINPKKRICPSENWVIRAKVSRHCLGNRNGTTPSSKSISPIATINELPTTNRLLPGITGTCTRVPEIFEEL